ncbi:hypothetical protein C2S53_012606 [Perilla frutescens var. hirtella]|uniref:MULE transposase domain-containing protein n=1 Tax=Perilla frutescens var. hirtella TaxID=608512 RepID=A0AAD4P0R2_PERFH|nr:hypothetical protein C2S53_012606 [Perilla frutescens var. hirtella]
MLEVACGIHNHLQAQYLEGHAYAGRLTSDEEKLVAEHAGRSQMQYLLGKLEEHGYYQYTRWCPQTDTVKDMFYAHPTSVKLLRAFPEVLLMDCTYKTNRADGPEHIPSVIVMDRERALMNAIEVTFPTTLLAETEARYGEMLRRFQEDYATNPTVVNYAINNWIVPYKAEGAHAKLKRFLGTSTCNLEECWEKIHDLLETFFNAIKASFEKSINVVQHCYKSLIFQFLRGANIVVATDVDNRRFETWNCANNMFAQADESERLLMLKIFREIVTPSTTSMVEPDVQTKTRGRPKVTKTKADTSMKREKSAFEYTDSFNDSCLQVPDSFECGTSLSQATFTTRRQKQKASRSKASYHLGIGYIDQIPASFRGYVARTQDVNADGHYGFRAIAGLVLGDQESWSRVRSDLFYEINSNPEMWDKCFLERGWREKVLKILNFHELTGLTRHWFVLPDLSHVVATVYKVALVTLGGRYPTTFLPLSSSVPTEPKCICMAHVKIGEGHRVNHFIRVFMNPDHPFPPISAQWKDYRMDCAAGWENFITRP